MTKKLVAIINSLKVPKIKKILLYEMKFLVPNYSCLQNPWLGGYRPPDPRSLCSLSPAEFIEPLPNKIPGYATDILCQDQNCTIEGVAGIAQTVKTSGLNWQKHGYCQHKY